MKRKSHIKRKPKHVGPPRIKKVKLTEDVVILVEAPPGHVPFGISDVNPQTMLIAPAPAKQPRETWMQYLFGSRK